jgi:hypothetical protein
MGQDATRWARVPQDGARWARTNQDGKDGVKKERRKEERGRGTILQLED